MGTYRGALAVAAKKAGVTRAEWLRRVDIGLKWCYRCKEWHSRTEFGMDRKRADGIAAACRSARRTFDRLLYPYKPVFERKPGGPEQSPARTGDKKQARQKINLEVRSDRLTHPNKLPCVDCGHIWDPGSQRRHEYDHYRGYGELHHLTVEVVCRGCHFIREGRRFLAMD
jgi:hypothetical protein